MNADAVSVPRVLSIAGTDPTGGAGIQADLKSIAATGGYGMAVVTSLVAQNTHGVRSVHTPPVSFLREQLEAVSDDVVIDAVKIGMLGSAATAAEVQRWLEAVRPPVVVVDPVMVATSGDRLLDADAEDALRSLLGHAHLVTPNLPELAALLGEPEARDWEAALDQGRRLADRSGVAVLVKGGHFHGASSPDALVEPGQREPTVTVRTERVDTRNTHGTGCSLSSALATLRVRTGSWAQALPAAKAWLQESLLAADELSIGTGNGPIHHFAGVWAAGLPPLEGDGDARAGDAGAGDPRAGDAGTGDAGSADPGTGDAGTAVADVRPLQPPGKPLRPAPVGRHTRALWDTTAGLRAGIDGLAFVRSLAAGTLEGAVFTEYLRQDALYLRGFSRALARASSLAPTVDEQAFWAAGARDALVTEMALHTEWLSSARVPADLSPSAVTAGYLDHLLTAAVPPVDGPQAAGAPREDPYPGGGAGAGVPAGEYSRLVGAVLPCYWIYADVGGRLHPLALETHPYRNWLETYSDEGFLAAASTAVAILEDTLGRADHTERGVISRAFETSCRWEYRFFGGS